MPPKPNRGKLTQAIAKSLKPTDREYIYWDAENLRGFGIRVSPSGQKSFLIQYRVRGAKGQRWVERQQTVGRLSYKTVDEAREEAREIKALASRGVDPVATQQEAQAAEDATREARQFTFAKLVARYRADHVLPAIRAGSLRRSSAAEMERRLKRWTDSIGDLPVNEIKKADVLSFLNDFRAAKNGTGLIEGNNLLTTLKQLFKWALDHDLVQVNPAEGVAKPLPKMKARDRVLTDDEIAKFWAACDQIGQPAGRIFQLLLLTAQRENEVAQMRWSELNLTNRIWTLPAERAKNGKEHIIHLSELTVEIIQGLKPIAGSKLVFTTNNPNKGFVNFDYAKRRVDHISGFLDYRIHDLRRTATTIMARLGIAPHVADKVLNHQSGTISGVAAIYNRYEYLEERKAALNALGRFIETLIGREPDNVVPLRQPA